MRANSDESSEEMMMVMVMVMRLMCKCCQRFLPHVMKHRLICMILLIKVYYSFYVVSFFLSISTELRLYRHMAAFCDDIGELLLSY